MLNTNIKAQNYPFILSTAKYVDGFPYGKTTRTHDYNDSKIIKWNQNKVVGNPIFLRDINVQDYIPHELLGKENEIKKLLPLMINEWNKNYSLKMAINNNGTYIVLQFVERNFLNQNYNFFENSNNSLVGGPDGRVRQGVIYFNSRNDKGFIWTSSKEPRSSKYMFGTVLLHELGHVLGMGHIDNSYTNAIMKASYNPAVVTHSLKECDKSNASKHSEKLYGIPVGISSNELG